VFWRGTARRYDGQCLGQRPAAVPELPAIVVSMQALDSRIIDQRLEDIRTEREFKFVLKN
jgi:hypothetical protein